MATYHYVGGCMVDPRFIRFVHKYKDGDTITVDHPDMIKAVKTFISNVDINKNIPVLYLKNIQLDMVVYHDELPGIWDVIRLDGDYIYIQPSYNGVSVSTTIKRVLKSEVHIWRKS